MVHVGVDLVGMVMTALGLLKAFAKMVVVGTESVKRQLPNVIVIQDGLVTHVQTALIAQPLQTKLAVVTVFVSMEDATVVLVTRER